VIENNDNKVYSETVKAGKRRTYFFDIKPTKGDDYYITITERKKKGLEEESKVYEKHKIFLYKEDLNKFLMAMNRVVDRFKGEIMPDYDFDQFDRREDF
jgi:hypothetical protein